MSDKNSRRLVVECLEGRELPSVAPLLVPIAPAVEETRGALVGAAVAGAGQAQPRGYVRVTVHLNDRAGTRVAGATVLLYNSSLQKVGQLTTDANGVVRFGNLSAGSYLVVVRKELVVGGRKVTFYGHGEGRLSNNSDGWTPFVQLQQVVTEPPLAFSGKNGRILVTVQRGRTRVEGAVVRLEDASGRKLGTFVSNDNGQVYFNDLRPGKYRVIVQVGNITRVVEGTLKDIPNPGWTPIVDLNRP